jgi:hypothetical protein
MTERPDDMAPEVAHAIKAVGEALAHQQHQWQSELAQLVAPGNPVRDLPADKVVFGHQDVQPVTAQMLIPGQEDRVSVTVWAAEDGVYLTAEPGTAPDVTTCAGLMAGVPLKLRNRAPVYAVASGGDPIRVDYVTEFRRL